jgi:hypothetical protein
MKNENLILISVACGFTITCIGTLTTNLSMFAVGVGMTIVGIAMLGFVKNVSK